MDTVQEKPVGVVPAKVEEQRRRAVTRGRELTDLMVRRPELYGVHKAADIGAESVLWSA